MFAISHGFHPHPGGGGPHKGVQSIRQGSQGPPKQTFSHLSKKELIIHSIVGTFIVASSDSQ